MKKHGEGNDPDSWNNEALRFIQHKRHTAYTAYQVTRAEIINQKKRIEDELEKHTQLLINKLTDNWMKINDNLTQQEKKLMETKLQHREMLTILPTEQMPRFHKCIFADKTMSKLLGDLEGGFDTSNFIELRQIMTYDSDLMYINPLCLMNDKTAVIGCATDNTFQKVDLGDKLKKVQVFENLRACAIVALKSGEILFSNAKDTSLRLIDLDGTVGIFQNFDPLHPKAVFVTEDNEVIVGLREKTSKPFVIERCSRRQLWRIDSHGRTRNIYEFDEKKNRLFTLPSRVTACKKQMFVLDTKGEDCGRIVSLDLLGNTQWIYNGHTFANYPFCPNDILLSNLEMLIITDTYNNALHFLNLNGEVVLYTTLTLLGIRLPCSIGMDFRGRLWVGTGKGKSRKAKIHVLSILDSLQ